MIKEVISLPKTKKSDCEVSLVSGLCMARVLRDWCRTHTPLLFLPSLSVFMKYETRKTFSKHNATWNVETAS